MKDSSTMDRKTRYTVRNEEYRFRMLASLVGALFLAWGSILYWPIPTDPDFSGVTFDVRGEDVVTLEQIQPTQQQHHKPPPPAPIPPVVVPDDVVLDDEVLDLQDDLLTVDDPGEDAAEDEGVVAPTTGISARADAGPKPVRIVEPEFSREARRKKLRVEVVLEVLVDARGKVKTARVIERYALNKDKTRKESVGIIGYGIEEAAVAAAEQWTFRPARKGGQRVRSYTTLTFSFGV